MVPKPHRQKPCQNRPNVLTMPGHAERLRVRCTSMSLCAGNDCSIYKAQIEIAVTLSRFLDPHDVLCIPAETVGAPRMSSRTMSLHVRFGLLALGIGIVDQANTLRPRAPGSFGPLCELLNGLSHPGLQSGDDQALLPHAGHSRLNSSNVQSTASSAGTAPLAMCLHLMPHDP